MTDKQYDVDVTVRVYADSPEEAKDIVREYLQAGYWEDQVEGFDFFGVEEV